MWKFRTRTESKLLTDRQQILRHFRLKKQNEKSLADISAAFSFSAAVSAAFFTLIDNYIRHFVWEVFFFYLALTREFQSTRQLDGTAKFMRITITAASITHRVIATLTNVVIPFFTWINHKQTSSFFGDVEHYLFHFRCELILWYSQHKDWVTIGWLLLFWFSSFCLFSFSQWVSDCCTWAFRSIQSVCASVRSRKRSTSLKMVKTGCESNQSDLMRGKSLFDMVKWINT